ncbi:MAG TPA: choice-of-anchor L domain-containing protein, partial [Flavobacterium sp.]
MKKITLLILAFFFSMLGYSQSEGFEGESTPNLVTDQWILGSGTWAVFDNGVGTAQSWTVNTTVSTPPAPPLIHSGERAAFINLENIGANNTSRDYLATPLFTIPDNGQLRFFTRTTVNGNQGTVYKIMVSTTVQNDPAAYVEVESWAENELTNTFNIYEEKVVDLSAYEGDQIYVAFVREFTQPTAGLGGDRWLIDDVRFVEKCLDVTNLNANFITLTTALLSWGNPSGATQWEIEIIPFAATPTGEGTIINTNPFLAGATTTPAEPFQPGTQYKYYVRAICSGSEGEVNGDWIGPFGFATQSPGETCIAPIAINTLPYSTTDSTSNYNDNTDDDQPGNCSTGGGNFMTGNEVFYSYTPTETGAISISMTPTSNWSGLFVYEGCANVGVNCVAGVANSGTTIREIPGLVVTAGVQYIIVISTNSDSGPQFTDYSLIIQALNCAPPTGLTAVGTGPNGASLSWQNPGAATSWEYAVQLEGDPIPAGAGVTTTSNTLVPVTTITGTNTELQLGVAYQYWVRADCGDGTFSPWAGPYEFNTTSCSSGCNYTFVMTDSFGDGWNGYTMDVIQDGLVIETIGDEFTDGEGPMTESVSLCDGPFVIVWNNNGSFPFEVGLSVINSFNQTIFTLTPGVDNPGSTIFSSVVDCANALCLPPTDLEVSNITTNGATLSWTPNGSAATSWEIYAVPSTTAPPVEGTEPTSTTSTFPVTIGGLLPDTEYVYYVRAVCDTPGTNPWSGASEPFQTLPTCPKPTNLGATGMTMTSAVLNWTPGGTETAWEVLVLPAGSPAPTAGSTGWLPASTSTFTYPDLTSGTAYDYYVRAVCDPTDSSTWAGPFSFTTTVCPPADQCLYTFTMTDTFGDGWNGNTMNIIQNGVTVAVIGSEFQTGLGPIEVQVALCNGIPFELYWNTGGFFANEVGVSITSFLGEELYTKAPGIGVQGSTLYSGTGECIPPTCLKPTNVVVSEIFLETAVVTWTENNPGVTSWDIIVLPASAPAPLPNATGWTNVDSNPYTLTDLTAATEYKVYVRSVCSPTDSSFWSLAVPFNTTVCLPSNLCEYTFVMVDSFGDSWNGNTMNVTQNGILVTTLTGPTNNDDQDPVSQTVELCNDVPFELFWNTGGNFATEVGISIVNSQTGAQVFTMAPGSDLQGTELFSGVVNCIPATCPKPVQLLVSDITQTSATFSWTEAATATTWELLILPAGSPAPTSATTGIIVTNPYTTDTLLSGTSNVFYVRAICAPGDISNWAGPIPFTTLIANDECDTAIVVSTNPDQNCNFIASGTLTGATDSGVTSTCFGTPDDDVWYQFVATSTAHNITITDSSGSTFDLYHAVYTGDTCGNLTLVYCSNGTVSTGSGLVVGQTYYVQVYSWTSTPGQTNSFTLCIGTLPPAITVSVTDYTEVQLIENVLLNSTCAGVSNITWSTGTNFGSTNGIGYFERNGSTFPFESGLVLSTGDAFQAPGPNDEVQGLGGFNWPGDADLLDVLADQGITGTTNNATVYEFDFVPVIDNISFNFVFASEEYGTFQCSFSDVFAFLLTNTETGVTTNLAVVPNTTTPIAVYTVRDAAFNGGCGSVNEEYFGDFYQLPQGVNPLAAPINFNGATVPLTAFANVVPGTTYHIKLAIADFNDSSYDSAVFIEGGSFGFGNIDLGENLLEETGNAICSGGSTTIDTALDPEIYAFEWFKNGEAMGETGQSITVDEEGEYMLEVSFIGTTCVGSDTVIVEYYDEVTPGTPSDLTICSTLPTGVFDLTQNNAVMLQPLGNLYAASFFLTAADAENNVNPISGPNSYTNISNPQTIYVRVYNSVAGCYEVVDFDLIIQDLTPVFTLPTDFTICPGQSTTIEITPGNFDLANATYVWTLNGQTLNQTGSSITVTAGGEYEVTVTHAGCTATMGVTVTIGTSPVVTTPGNQTVCGSYILPALTAGNYFTGPGATGDTLPVDTEITQTTTLYVYVADAVCPGEAS